MKTCGSVCHLLPVGFLLGLFFDLEDGGDMFIRKVPSYVKSNRYNINSQAAKLLNDKVHELFYTEFLGTNK
jgi:hypothetical protein